MNCLCTAYIEKDVESGMYVGYVPGIIGAHTCAETIDKLKDKLTEVVALCIEEMDDSDKENLPIFAGISQIEIAI